MVITFNTLQDLYLRLQLDATPTQSPVLILAAQDLPSTATLSALETFLDSKTIKFSVVPISSLSQLWRQIWSLQREGPSLSSVVCINIGAIADMKQIWPLQINCYVYDRPSGNRPVEFQGKIEEEEPKISYVEKIEEEPKSLKRTRDEEIELSPKRVKTENCSTLISEGDSDLSDEDASLASEPEVAFDLDEFDRLERCLAAEDSDDSVLGDSEYDRDELENWFLSVIQTSKLPTAAQALRKLGNSLQTKDVNDNFEDLYITSLNKFTARFPNSLESAQALLLLGRFYSPSMLSSSMESEDYYLSALRICTEHFPNSLERALIETALGDLYAGESEFEPEIRAEMNDKAEHLYIDAWLRYRWLNPKSRHTVASLNRLGKFYMRLERFGEAELRFQNALTTHGLSARETAETVSSLRKLYSIGQRIYID